MNNGKKSVDAGNNDTLGVYGHCLQPLTVSQGAVLRWICVDCEETSDEVTDYAEFTCTE